MKYSNIHLIYFSPTHTSAKIVCKTIAEGMGAASMSESDVTCESLDMEEYIDDELTNYSRSCIRWPCGGDCHGTFSHVPFCPPCAGSPRGTVWEHGIMRMP